MPNPLRELAPILEVLAENIDVLPAAGKAVEDYLHPDPEELEDVLINNEVGEVTAFAEVPEPKLTNLYRPTPPIFRHQKPFYRYFIDGSIRTYFLATGIEGTRSFPIELAQVGAAVVERNYDGNVKVLASNHKVLLLIPKGAQGVSDAVWQQLEKIKTADGLIEIHNVDKKHALNKSEEGEGDLRNKAGAKARHRMHELEIELIKATEGLRNESNWLILDGAVKLDDFVNSPYLIGVAKSFRKDPQFYFGRKHGRNQERHDVTAILAGLPHAHRTVAFSAYGGKVAFWYVRLREQRELDYPLMGVVKVELPRPHKTPVDAELADLISGALVAERNVAPYGRDRRWHCHLYPIFIAEQVIKSRFFSQDVLLGAIRWPRR
ncbi:hypothetical protein MGLY_16360 [Neomoorella glycerini]|uniref:NurA domain-containing protein n=1 Tax=Neomoorella glycerini TaxID=55779 RepID=A0A6I5ZRN7_9FIRM|nr:hypothetical protein [Moorella glycerini]QGP92265.1 hypothetical protein MGLY_16360 [Moorella glycerini]